MQYNYGPRPETFALLGFNFTMYSRLPSKTAASEDHRRRKKITGKVKEENALELMRRCCEKPPNVPGGSAVCVCGSQLVERLPELALAASPPWGWFKPRGPGPFSGILCSAARSRRGMVGLA